MRWGRPEGQGSAELGARRGIHEEVALARIRATYLCRAGYLEGAGRLS